MLSTSTSRHIDNDTTLQPNTLFKKPTTGKAARVLVAEDEVLCREKQCGLQAFGIVGISRGQKETRPNLMAQA